MKAEAETIDFLEMRCLHCGETRLFHMPKVFDGWCSGGQTRFEPRDLPWKPALVVGPDGQP